MIRPVVARGAAAANPGRETRNRLALPREARRLGLGASAVRPSSPTKACRAWGFGAARRNVALRRRLTAFPRKHPLRSIPCSFIGLCPRGRMFIFVDGRARRRLGRFSVSPRPSPPKPAWAFSGLPHGAGVCGGFDCFLGRLFWRCSFSPFGRASGFFFCLAAPFVLFLPRRGFHSDFFGVIRHAFARKDCSANLGGAQSLAAFGALAHFIS